MDGTSDFSTMREWNEALERSLRQILPTLFHRVSGVSLRERQESSAVEWCTAYMLVGGPFSLALAVHLSEKLLWRASCSALSSDYVGREDMEEFEQEFFNVLTGRLLSGLCWRFDRPVGLCLPGLAAGKHLPGPEEGVGGMCAYSAGEAEELELCWRFSECGAAGEYGAAPNVQQYGNAAE